MHTYAKYVVMRRSHADGVMPEEAVAAGVFLFLRAPVGVGLSFRSLVERLGERVRFGDLLGVSTLAALAAEARATIVYVWQRRRTRESVSDEIV